VSVHPSDRLVVVRSTFARTATRARPTPSTPNSSHFHGTFRRGHLADRVNAGSAKYRIFLARIGAGRPSWKMITLSLGFLSTSSGNIRGLAAAE
jgi:hypothetical protein